MPRITISSATNKSVEGVKDGTKGVTERQENNTMNKNKWLREKKKNHE
jgi:hypothetical protein